MHFIDKKLHLKGFLMFFLFTFIPSKSFSPMDNYIITLGLYLVLMLFFKVYYAVAAKE